MMPSQIIHLAIAKRYLQKHPGQIKDVQRFIDGNILPDLAPDKAASHCGVRTERNNLGLYVQQKVNPQKFLQTHDLSDDLDKGQYLHLYVDYQYYNVFLHDYYQNTTFAQSSIDMYETSRRDDQYLMQKDGVSYQDTTKCADLIKINQLWDQEQALKRQQKGYHCAMMNDLVQLEAFVEAMASVQIPD